MQGAFNSLKLGSIPKWFTKGISKMIDNFSSKHHFLSNFYPEDMEYEGETYFSSEHAYQAAKATNEEDKQKVRRATTAYASKKAGRAILCRKDWENVKEDVMLEVLRAKFSNLKLKEMLLETGEEELVEGNTWGDTYWGVCKGKGKNALGRALMKVREECKDSDSTEEE